MKQMHLTDPEGRDATVLYASIQPAPTHDLGLPGHEVSFRRYLATPEGGLHAALVDALGEDYGQALIDGDPEVDVEQVGRALGTTDAVYLSSGGEVLFAAPKLVEVVLGPDGQERERRDPVDVEGNINDELPVRWTRLRMKKAEAARRFVFGRTVQVRHADGLTYDYLHSMAKALAEADEMAMLGGGERGRDPLRFQRNGSPYRAFLEGRVDGDRYQLLLHLSNLELKRPGGVE